MKIGIDCHNLEGDRTGTARYLLNLLKEWNKLNPKSQILNPSFILYFKKEIPKDLNLGEKFEKKVLSLPFKFQSNALFQHYLLPKAIKKDKVDIYFSPTYVLPLRLPKKIKTVVAIHDISYEAHPEWFSWQNRILLRWISKRSAKKTDALLTCSKFSQKEIIKHYKTNPGKISVIPLASDSRLATEDSLPLGSNEALKTLKKYDIKNKFIFYVGAIFNRRFPEEMIKAFAKVAGKLPEYQFLISGPNYTKPYIDINQLIKKTNQEIGRETILRVEYVEEKDLSVLYSAADLFIWLSSYEGFGLPPLEAMASGAPVITTDMASLPEVVGESALLVKNPEDVDEISEKIYQGLTDKNLREELIEKGTKQASKFSWAETAKETLRVFTKLE